MGYVIGALVLVGVVVGAVLAHRAGLFPTSDRRPTEGRLARRVSEAAQAPSRTATDDYIDSQAAVWERYSQRPVARAGRPDPSRRPDPASHPDPSSRPDPAPRPASGDRFGRRRAPQRSARTAAADGSPGLDVQGPPRRDREVPSADTPAVAPRPAADPAPPDMAPVAASPPVAERPSNDAEVTVAPITHLFRPAVVESLSASEDTDASGPAQPAVAPLARRTPKKAAAAARPWSVTAERVGRPVGRTRRSPDQVRANLASYRDGRARARGREVSDGTDGP